MLFVWHDICLEPQREAGSQETRSRSGERLACVPRIPAVLRLSKNLHAPGAAVPPRRREEAFSLDHVTGQACLPPPQALGRATPQWSLPHCRDAPWGVSEAETRCEV